jgi:Domain of unknown function (DUF697)
MSDAPADNAKAVEAKQLVRHYMFGSITTQLVPTLPLLEYAVQAEVQVQLVRSIAKIYTVTFCGKRARELIKQLIGDSPGQTAFKLFKNVITQSATSQERSREGKELLGLIANEGVTKVAGDLIKATIPGARLVLGYDETIEILSTLYAVGHVFILHFESGGTLQTFDPTSFRQEFKEQTYIGRDIAILRFKPKE